MRISQYEKHEFPDVALPFVVRYGVGVSSKLCSLHWHENPEFLFVTHGCGYVHLDNTKIPVTKDDIVVVNPNKMHAIYATAPELRYYCLIVNKAFCEQFGFYTDQTTLLEKIQDDGLFSLMVELNAEMKTHSAYYKSAATSKLLQILLCLHRNYLNQNPDTSGQSKSFAMVKSAITFMTQHCLEDLSVSDIAQKIGYSKYYFCRVFREITGHTVNDYFNSLKMQQAYAYLQKTNLSVGDTAAWCGLDNISYFTKLFKKYIGILPSDVRRQKKKNEQIQQKF